MSGFSSGEGLIENVRDEVKKWNAKEKSEEIIDPGVQDKRLFVTEPESPARSPSMDSHGNSLSPSFESMG